MAVVSRQLTLNITISSTWKQMIQGHGGAAYLAPSSGSNPRADVKLLRALNLSSGSTQVEFAFSSASTIADDQYVVVRRTMQGYGIFNDDSVHVLRTGEGIWARLINSAGSPNVTLRASLLEVS